MMLQIRMADESDMEAIIRIAKETWPVAYGDILSADQLRYMLKKFYSPASLISQMKEQHHTFIVAEDPISETVGFASYSKTGKDAFHLHKLYVLPRNQGKMTGQKLMDFIVREVSTAGGRRLLLNVNRENPAVGFYEKAGFRIIRQEDIDIGNNFFMNDFVMELRIG